MTRPARPIRDRGRHTNFQEIRFGYVSAEKESSDAPDLLLNGYFDLSQAVQQVLDGQVSLCLGYKGTGKTALAERLSLLSASDSELFVKSTLLSDFPYGSLRNVVVRDSPPEASYPDAWAWLLLLSIVDSLERDQGKKIFQHTEYARTVKFLHDLKLLPSTDLGKLVQISSSRGVKAKISAFEADLATGYGSADVPMFVLVEHLKRLIASIRSESRHILFVDGLDQVFSSGQKQFRTLSTLINEAVRLNNLFRSSKAPIRIVVLCRTDLFEMLPDANKNKIRQDEALDFDWYQDTKNTKKLYLVQMIQLRASLSAPDVSDIFSEFLVASHDVV